MLVTHNNTRALILDLEEDALLMRGACLVASTARSRCNEFEPSELDVNEEAHQELLFLDVLANPGAH